MARELVRGMKEERSCELDAPRAGPNVKFVSSIAPGRMSPLDKSPTFNSRDVTVARRARGALSVCSGMQANQIHRYLQKASREWRTEWTYRCIRNIVADSARKVRFDVSRGSHGLATGQ